MYLKKFILCILKVFWRCEPPINTSGDSMRKFARYDRPAAKAARASESLHVVGGAPTYESLQTKSLVLNDVYDIRIRRM